MALTKSCGAFSTGGDWTAVAQNAVSETSALDVSDSYETTLVIQAMHDAVDAHTGTEFIVQGSSATSGDEDWYDILRFVDLVATSKTENIVDNPLTASSTTINQADTDGFETFDTTPLPWRAIEDSTLVNSELVLQTGATVDDLITILDGTTNEHAQNTPMYNTAISRGLSIGIGHYRIRIVVNNKYDINGASINYKARYIKVTGL